MRSPLPLFALPLLMLLGPLTPSPARGANEAGARLHALLGAGDVVGAEALLKGLEGSEAQITRFQGLLAMKKGDLEEAREAFVRVLELKPRWISTWMVLAQAQLGLKLPADALASLTRCAGLGEDRIGYYRLKARAHLGVQRPDDALATLRAGRKRFPEAEELELDATLVLTQAGLHHQAIEELEALIARDALSPRHLSLAGPVLAAAHATPGALALLERLLHRFPTDGALRTQAGFAYARRGAPLTAGRFFALAATFGEDTAFAAADQFRLAGALREALQWNARVLSRARALPQRLTIYLEAERYHRATTLQPLLEEAGLMVDSTRFALGYAWIQVGELAPARSLAGEMEPSPARTSLEATLAQVEEFRLEG